MTQQTRKSYEPAFKLQAAKIVREQCLSIAQVCADLSVGRTALNRWVQQYDAELAGQPTSGPGLTPEQQEIRKLQRELKQLREDNALLKKASAFFAQAMRC